MPNEEETIVKYIKTSLFVLFMLAIGTMAAPEWAIITILCLIYLKGDENENF